MSKFTLNYREQRQNLETRATETHKALFVIMGVAASVLVTIPNVPTLKWYLLILLMSRLLPFLLNLICISKLNKAYSLAIKDYNKNIPIEDDLAVIAFIQNLGKIVEIPIQKDHCDRVGLTFFMNWRWWIFSVTSDLFLIVWLVWMIYSNSMTSAFSANL